MNPEETGTEYDRLLGRTNELCKATNALCRSPTRFNRAEHETLAAELREHHFHVRAHKEKQERAHHLRRL
jgi:uncharacterized protein (DUF2461 family)